ncbi:hypothetical protein [Paratractidigestivibacter sp.]|uniref:hypothetical protein n=1 Tax=Paratractidigestivibacter sp. TaxID=2847316 RepID=UPI002AC96417|nr:hypothetical protein [Paratractidigestivibacter sp.]
MHDLSLNLFYKTSFDIVDEGADGKDPDALWAVVLGIRTWIVKKWKRQGVDIDGDLGQWGRFKAGTKVELGDSDGTVRFESALYAPENGRLLWSCRVTETIRVTGYADRTWVTEVGFESDSLESGAVSIVLSYGDRPGYLGPLQPDPKPTVPGLINTLDNWASLTCTCSGRRLPLEARELRAGDFDDFWTLVSDEGRNTPVIFVSPRYSRLAVSPRELAKVLGPSAFVFYSVDDEFCREMRDKLPDRALRCEYGQVRIYSEDAPLSEVQRHRFFNMRDIDAIGSEAFIGMVRRALAQDVDWYERIVRIEAIRSKRGLARINALAARDVEETKDELLEEAIRIEGEKSAEKKAREDAEAEAKSLAAKCYELEGRCSTYEQALASRGAEGPELGLEVGHWPVTALEIVKIFLAANPGRLGITDRGLESLSECRTKPELVWNALYDLTTVAYDLHTNSRSVNFKKEFESRSEFEYSPSAGKKTREDSKLMSEYLDTWRGREINAERHLRKGGDPNSPNFLRLYYCFDQETGMIVISSIGPHLRNWSTRKIH